MNEGQTKKGRRPENELRRFRLHHNQPVKMSDEGRGRSSVEVLNCHLKEQNFEE